MSVLGPLFRDGALEALVSPAGPLAKAWGEGAKAVAWLASRTGLPSLILAAAALVIALRLARKVGRIALEFALAVVLLVALRKLGWVGW